MSSEKVLFKLFKLLLLLLLLLSLLLLLLLFIKRESKAKGFLKQTSNKRNADCVWFLKETKPKKY